MYCNVCYFESMDEFLTTKEIASILKVNIITVRRWIVAGRLPATFLGKEYRVTKKILEKFLEARKVKKS